MCLGCLRWTIRYPGRGGGGVRYKKIFMQEIELQKNSCMRLTKEKKIRATS